MIDFAEIKARHPLEDVLYKRGIELKRIGGELAGKCPLHREQHGSSFSVNTTEQVWICRGKCQTGGDVFTLIQHLDGAADALAAAEILEGRPLTEEEHNAAPRVPQEPRPQLVIERELPACPKLFLGEERHHRQVAHLRKLDWTSMERAQVEGCLRYLVAYNQPAYALLDVDNPCNIQVRRMDGQLWFERSKVMGIRGNWAGWPVGLNAAIRHPDADILLVEGTGDFLAGWDIHTSAVANVVPVAMFGASQPIAAGALPLFSHRRVIIIQQHDEAGANAAARWAEQLSAAHANVRTWTVPDEGADLNDFISAGGDADRIFSKDANDEMRDRSGSGTLQEQQISKPQ